MLLGHEHSGVMINFNPDWTLWILALIETMLCWDTVQCWTVLCVSGGAAHTRSARWVRPATTGQDRKPTHGPLLVPARQPHHHHHRPSHQHSMMMTSSAAVVWCHYHPVTAFVCVNHDMIVSLLYRYILRFAATDLNNTRILPCWLYTRKCRSKPNLVILKGLFTAMCKKKRGVFFLIENTWAKKTHCDVKRIPTETSW